MPLKLLVTGTGKDGTATIWEIIRQAHALNGASAVVQHEPDVFPIVDNYRQILETGNPACRARIIEIIRGWTFDVAVSGSMDFCLDLFREVYGPGLKIIHLTRDKERYLDSVIHSTKARHESHGNYLLEEEGRTFTLYRPAAFHYGDMTREAWEKLSLRERYGWYYEKIHALHRERVTAFDHSLQVTTESLSDPDTIERITKFIDPSWLSEPAPIHRNAMRLINYDQLSQEERLRFHRFFTGFDIQRFMRSPLYPANYFLQFVDAGSALKSDDPELNELRQRVDALAQRLAAAKV